MSAALRLVPPPPSNVESGVHDVVIRDPKRMRKELRRFRSRAAAWLYRQPRVDDRGGPVPVRVFREHASVRGRFVHTWEGTVNLPRRPKGDASAWTKFVTCSVPLLAPVDTSRFVPVDLDWRNMPANVLDAFTALSEALALPRVLGSDHACIGAKTCSGRNCNGTGIVERLEGLQRLYKAWTKRKVTDAKLAKAVRRVAAQIVKAPVPAWVPALAPAHAFTLSSDERAQAYDYIETWLFGPPDEDGQRDPKNARYKDHDFSSEYFVTFFFALENPSKACRKDNPSFPTRLVRALERAKKKIKKRRQSVSLSDNTERDPSPKISVGGRRGGGPTESDTFDAPDRPHYRETGQKLHGDYTDVSKMPRRKRY